MFISSSSNAISVYNSKQVPSYTLIIKVALNQPNLFRHRINNTKKNDITRQFDAIITMTCIIHPRIMFNRITYIDIKIFVPVSLSISRVFDMKNAYMLVFFTNFLSIFEKNCSCGHFDICPCVRLSVARLIFFLFVF